MNNKILDKLEYAIKNNEFRKFLKGEGEYRIPNRDGFFSDLSAALYSGIYEYCRLYPDKNLNIIFENEIISMFNGENFEIMCAFDYCWRHIICEERNKAPFKLSEHCLNELKNVILKKQDILSTYKVYSEFGGVLDNGAYQYAENIDKMLQAEYGRRIL